MEIERLVARTHRNIGRLHADSRWVAGLMLYWAEGSKTSNGLRLANSDPDLIRMFMQWVVDYVHPDVEFRGQLSLHAGNDEQAALMWWSSQLGLAPAQFLKTFVKPDGTGHRRNHLKHGTCQLRVQRSADHLHTILGWISGFRELTAIEEPLSSPTGR